MDSWGNDYRGGIGKSRELLGAASPKVKALGYARFSARTRVLITMVADWPKPELLEGRLTPRLKPWVMIDFAGISLVGLAKLGASTGLLPYDGSLEA